ncbi:MAG: hypothetical protein U0802_16865 [Candidatus Binatia bacterium]
MKALILSFALLVAMPVLALLRVAKVGVLSSGKILLNGSPVDLAAVEAEFKRLQAENGSVWYYREAAEGEPPPEAMSIMELVVKYKIPIRLSASRTSQTMSIMTAIPTRPNKPYLDSSSQGPNRRSGLLVTRA